jgi:16S rRNA C967 or C1407 C5-methylase (RsmB/RsmF family)
VSKRAQRKAELEQALKDDYADRHLRMTRGQVPNVYADMESRRRLQSEWNDIIAAESEPPPSHVRADRLRFIAKCIAALLALTGIGLGVVLSSIDEDRSKEGASQSVELSPVSRPSGA